MVGNKARFKRAAENRSVTAGERIHSDVKTVSVRSRTGCKYAVCFVDDATRRGKSYGIKHKSEVLDKWQQFLEEELLARGLSCKYLRSDHGGEYISEEMTAFNNVRGIQAERSPPHCQSADGVSEVYFRETFKMVRTIIWDQQRSHGWWLVALGFADIIRNHLTTAALDGKVPESAFIKKPVEVGHFRVPLTRCWSYVESGNRSGTISARRIECVFVGYAPKSTSYEVMDVESGTVYNRRHADVVFDEASKAPDGVDPDVKFVDTFLAALEIRVVAAETCAAGKNALLANPGFLRTTRDHSIRELAKLFGMDAAAYLKFLHETPVKEGSGPVWYQGVTLGAKVAKGSDVPIPIKGVGKTSTNPIKGVAIGGTSVVRPGALKRVDVSVSKGVRRSVRLAHVQQAMLVMEQHAKSEYDLWASVACRPEPRMQEPEGDVLSVHEAESALSVEEVPGSIPVPKGYRKAHAGEHSVRWRQAESKE